MYKMFYTKYILTFPLRIMVIVIPAWFIGIFSKPKAVDYVLKNDWLDKWISK